MAGPKGTKHSQTYVRRMPFRSCTQTIRKHIKVIIARYASVFQYKQWNKMKENRNVTRNFSRGGSVANSRKIAGRGCNKRLRDTDGHFILSCAEQITTLWVLAIGLWC
jgi:hypothetical protein